MIIRLPSLFFILLSLSVSGCLPSSCNRNEPRELYAADSLSRARASTLPVDTLLVLGSITGDLGHPRTLAFAPDGALWVTDTEKGRIHRISANDIPAGEAPGRDGGEGQGQNQRQNQGQLSLPPALLDMNSLPTEVDRSSGDGSDSNEGDRFPYLAGFAADTALVFEPAEHALWHVAPSGAHRAVYLQGETPAVGGLRYAAARDSVVAVKVVADEFDGYMALLDAQSGEILEQTPLTGPAWQHAGLMRLSGTDVISLSAYLPRVVQWAPGVSAPDSLRLFGFDSPMLARMRQFILGDTHAPPMLSVSAAVTPTRFYVINMRPGWLRLDVYDRGGELRYILTEPRPAFNKDFYPTDIAVREQENGSVIIAVAVLEPEPGVSLFRWSALAAAATALPLEEP